MRDDYEFQAALSDKQLKGGDTEETVEAEKELTEEQRAAMDRAIQAAQERKLREMRQRRGI